jgi:hypothetical protein
MALPLLRLFVLPNGFIVSVADDGGYGEIFHRNDQGMGVVNHPDAGPWFGDAPPDLYISDSCDQGAYSSSKLGGSYGREPWLNQYELFGQDRFRAADYEVFKILID